MSFDSCGPTARNARPRVGFALCALLLCCSIAEGEASMAIVPADIYEQPSFIKTIFSLITAPFFGLGAGLAIRRFLGAVTHVEGPSMLPTVRRSGDYVLYEKLSVALQRIKVGDVIICRSPQDPNLLLCKRVRGLAGDRIRCDGRIIQVPPNKIWVEGDNSENSIDSRHYGAVPRELLVGKVVCRIFPFTRVGPLRNPILSRTFPRSHNLYSREPTPSRVSETPTIECQISQRSGERLTIF